MKTIRIENSGHEPQIINVPDGAKVIIEDGLTEKYIPKVGDYFMSTRSFPTIAYCNELIGNNPKCTSVFIESGKISIETGHSNVTVFSHSNEFKKLTKDEFQSEFNKLGYEYDFETHEARKLRFKPEAGEKYYYVQGDGVIENSYFIDYPIEQLRYKIGNCYRTYDEAIPRQQHYLSFKD